MGPPPITLNTVSNKKLKKKKVENGSKEIERNHPLIHKGKAVISLYFGHFYPYESRD
jgi:hypothetical protein